MSTYNRPKALELILKALVNQTDKDFEIIIADDGSDARTEKTIINFQKKFTGFNIKHIWQEDKGFRLARIRNLAVLASVGEYLIFLDGDCLPPPNFIENHRALSEPGWAVYGQRILASSEYTRYLEQNNSEVLTGSFWKLKNFLKLYKEKKINRILPMVEVRGNVWRKISPYQWERIRGCNWAMWRESYYKINGSDESFEGWGAEDKDVAVRLLNSNVLLKDGRCFSYVLHLWHPVAKRDNNKEQSLIVNRRFNKKIIKPKKGLF